MEGRGGKEWKEKGVMSKKGVVDVLVLKVCQPCKRYMTFKALKLLVTSFKLLFPAIAFEMQSPLVYIRIVKKQFFNLKQNKQICHFSYLNLYVLIRMSKKIFIIAGISDMVIYYSAMLLSIFFHKHLTFLKHTFKKVFCLKDFKNFSFTIS